MNTELSHAPMASPVPRSPWHSPVPYLFGGLAAMLGLIAFALLILACSYWKLSGYLDSGDNNSGDRDVELGVADPDGKPKLPAVFEEKLLVIMAGEEKPTFLATPISSRASSFKSNHSGGEVVRKRDGEGKEKKTGGSEDQVQVQLGDTERHDDSLDQVP